MSVPLPPQPITTTTVRARPRPRLAGRFGSHTSLRLASAAAASARTPYSGSPQRRPLRLALPFHQAQVVDREAAAEAEDGHDDGQADRDFGGGDRHDEEDEGLSVVAAEPVPKGHEGE